MYLPGQLPYGPPSSNVGAAPNFDGTSTLFGDSELTAAIPPGSGPGGGTSDSETTWVTPDGGDVIVNPTTATGNGVVQFPITSPGSLSRFARLPSGGNSCPDAAPASDTGLGSMDAPTYQEHYGKAPPDPNQCLQLQCGAIPQAGNEQLNLDCSNFGYAGARSCVDPDCAPFLSAMHCAPQPTAPIQPAVSSAPVATNYVSAPLAVPDVPCGGYGSDSSLTMIANSAARGLSGCCQSGYQRFTQNKVGPPSPPLGWAFIAAAALLLLTPSGAK